MESLSGLLNNAALMLVLCVIYDTFNIYAIPKIKLRDSLTGVLVGFICIAVMLNPWSLERGLYFDTRWVLLSLCGLYFGLIPTTVGVVIAGAFRLYQGGPGGIVGTVVIVVTACVGLAWKYWKDKSCRPLNWMQLYAFGVVVQLAMLSCMFLFPDELRNTILSKIALPILIIYPVLTAIIGLVLQKQEKRRISDRALLYSTSLATAALDSTPDGILIVDRDGKIARWNQKFVELWDVPEHLLDTTVKDPVLSHASSQMADPEEFQYKIMKLYERPEQSSYDTLYLADGRIFNRYSQPQKIGNEIVGRFWSFRDITESKKADDAIKASEVKFRTIFDSVNDAILIHDIKSGAIVDVNRRMCEMFGMTHKEAIRSSVGELSANIPPYRQEDAANWMEKAAKGTPQLFEWHARHKNGTLFWVECSLRRSFIGTTDRILLTLRDITERKLTEEVLRRFENLVTFSHDIIFFVRRHDLQIVEANPAATKAYGYSREQLLKMTIYQLRVPDTLDLIEAQAEQADKQGILFETVHHRSDGSTFPVEVSSRGETIDGVRMLINVARDISERKRTELALKESEAQLSFLIKNSSDALVIINADGTQRYVSPGAERITGFPTVELEGRPIDTLIHPDDLKDITEAWNEAIAHPEKTVTVQYRHIHKTQGWVISEAIAQSFMNEPAINGVIASVRNITERKNAEELLRASEKKFEAVFQHSPVGLVLLNGKGAVLDCNQYLANIFGIHQGENIGLNLLDRLPEGLVRQCLLNAISNEGVHHYEGPYASVMNGKEIYISAFSEKVTPDLLIVIIMDITERKRAEDELRESEDKFSMTFKSSPDSVNINRLEDGLYVDVNEGFTRITGFTREDVIGKTSLELNIWENLDDRERMVKGLREKGYIENLETQFRKKDGSLLTGLMSARLIYPKGVPHLINITRDITELKTLESERLKIEKLESIGILAGGIAHDFNNILTGIMGNISFAKVLVDTDHKSYKALAEAEKAAARAGELANQLLTFARGGEPIKKVVSPKDLVNEALSFVLRGSNIKGIVDIPDSIHALDVDEGQISQVFQNIIINATHAMPGGGVITFAAQNEVLIDNNTLSLPPGPYLRFTIADQGCGIPEDDLTRIFDPYFTTKSTGTGLGLASVHSIVNRHRGNITVKSTVGQGTTFTIYLPSIGQIYKQYKDDVVQQEAEHRKGSSILIMDDEEMIREVASSMLVHLGYEVTVCADGEDAVELFKKSIESGVPYSIVIMDLTIPGGLGGKEAAERILSFYPGACLVVSSGYSNDPIISKYQEYGFKGAITKPYNINNFRGVLESLLLKAND